MDAMGVWGHTSLEILPFLWMVALSAATALWKQPLTGNGRCQRDGWMNRGLAAHVDRVIGWTNPNHIGKWLGSPSTLCSYISGAKIAFFQVGGRVDTWDEVESSMKKYLPPHHISHLVLLSRWFSGFPVWICDGSLLGSSQLVSS